MRACMPVCVRACVRVMKLACKINVVDVDDDELYKIHISIYFMIVSDYWCVDSLHTSRHQ